LRHFYSVYDFDKDTVSLGINKHSEGKVSMYKPGHRPDNLVKVQRFTDNLVQTSPDKNSTTQIQLVEKEPKNATTQAQIQNKPENKTTQV
jgi:hypothetical protein